MFPLLVLGGLALLVLTSSKPAPAPSSATVMGQLVDMHLIMAMERLADAADARAGIVRRPREAIVPNVWIPGQPAGWGTVHVGYSCTASGCPVVMDQWGRAFLLTA